ncbi:hypothetical protein CsSME_00001888 [Camellia sinensis var. sinensis]
MVCGVSRKRPTASNRRCARQTEPEALEVNASVEEDDHGNANNDYVDDNVGVEDDNVDNDIGVEADLMEDDVVHRLSCDERVLHPDMLYETIGRMLQVLDGHSVGSTLTRTEYQVYYRKRCRMDGY